ncbi:MAG: isoprenoid biosynthesis glyoxalase ElbB [Bacteroidales bacterium]
MKKIAVILSGCGVFDGAEIHEAVMTLYAILKNGAVYEIFAPDIEQFHVINHLTGEESGEKRNVLVESARIARGKIKNIAFFNAEDFDGIIFPGGFGVAKNLSSYAFNGSKCSVDLTVEQAVKAMVKKGKPVGALCIAPALMARILKDAMVTIGNDADTIENIELMGSKHKTTNHGEIVVDEKYKLVTSPCYMLDANIIQIAEGADNVVKKMLSLM